MRELDDLLSALNGDGFFDAVIAEYHRVGKHFVSDDLLDALDQARESTQLLTRFLDTALDKRDGRYDYRSYLALDLLPLPGSGNGRLDESPDTEAAQRKHDRLLVQLIADMLRFELDALDGRTRRFPQQRPGPATVAKRFHLGLRAVAPMSRRVGIRPPAVDGDPQAAARAFCVLAEQDRTPAEERALQLSDLPVYVVHDEYMFIRVLQSFETAFALLTVSLQAAIEDITAGRVKDAADRLQGACLTLREAARCFSLLATMQVKSFQTFRLYTEGASAIQSRNYKLVESLCRTPDGARLDSAAFRSVPEIRADVLAGRTTLDEALRGALHDTGAAARIDPAELRKLKDAMRAFAATLTQWRQTHYSLALRMLGDLDQQGGTGYTEGTPYLAAVRGIPVFRELEELEELGELPELPGPAEPGGPGAGPGGTEAGQA